MEPGTELDPNILIQVLQNKLAQAVIREAQLEAAVQGLMGQVQTLDAQLDTNNTPMQPHEEVHEDASANQPE